MSRVYSVELLAASSTVVFSRYSSSTRSLPARLSGAIVARVGHHGLDGDHVAL
jgi:hypothetical protein